MFPLVVGALATVGGWAVWVFCRTPRRRDQAITEAEALNYLSDGFEWHYDHPIVSFALADGSVVLLERRFGSAASWYLCRSSDSVDAEGPGDDFAEGQPERRWFEARAHVSGPVLR